MLFQSSLGVDIQDGQIALAYLRSSLRGTQLQGQLVQPLEAGLDAGDRQRRIVATIEAFCSDHGIASADIFIVLPPHQAMVREIRLPAAVRENLRDTLNYQIEKYYPLPADKLYFDYLVAGEEKSSQQITVLLVAVRRESVDAILHLFAGLGMGISGVETRFTALASCYGLDPDVNRMSRVAFFWSDESGCAMALSSGGQLVGCRRFGMAASPSDEDLLAVERWITDAVAPGNDDALTLAVTPSAGAHPVIRHLGGHRQVRLHTIHHALLDRAPEQTVFAMGAALKGLRQSSAGVNLLPPKMRKPTSRFGVYAFFALSLLAVIGVVVWTGSWIAANRQFVSGLDTQLNQLRREVVAVKDMQEAADRMTQRIQSLNAITGQRLSVLAIARELSREIPDGAWLKALTLNDDSLRLEGYAASASELVTILEALPLFSEVGFLSPITVDKNGKERFNIGLTVLK